MTNLFLPHLSGYVVDNAQEVLRDLGVKYTLLFGYEDKVILAASIWYVVDNTLEALRDLGVRNTHSSLAMMTKLFLPQSSGMR